MEQKDRQEGLYFSTAWTELDRNCD